MGKTMYCLFKLKHDIRVESKVDVAKEEIEIFTEKNVLPIESIASLFKKEPFSLLDDHVIKIMDRMPYLGKVQAFLVETELNLIRELVERITLFKEIFFVFWSTRKEAQDDLRKLGFDFHFKEIKRMQLAPYAQLFPKRINEQILTVVRTIPFQEIFECGLEVLKLPKVAFVKYKNVEKKIEMQEKGIVEGINELFHYLNNVHDRCPRFGLSKDNIGDYVDWAFSRFRKYGLHFIHKHRAKADARMARMVLNILGVNKGDVILDPFCGSGSFIADAPIMGIKAYGVDISPLSTLITKVKCNLEIPVEELREELIRLVTEAPEIRGIIDFIEPKEGKPFDLTDVISKLPDVNKKIVLKKREHVNEILVLKKKIDKTKNPEVRNFFKVILSRAIVKEFEKKHGVNIRKSFENDAISFYLVLFATQKIASKLGITFGPKPTIYTADTRELTLPEKVSGILTSPPYFDAINYLDAVEMYSLVILRLLNRNANNLNENIIGSKVVQATVSREKLEKSEIPASSKKLIAIFINHGRSKKASIIYRYVCDMLTCFQRLYELLESDRRMIFVVGKYHHWKLDNDTLRVDGARIISDLAVEAGFTKEYEIFHTIHKIDAGTRITSESILIFKKSSKALEIRETEKARMEETLQIIPGRVITKIKKYFVKAE